MLHSTIMWIVFGACLSLELLPLKLMEMDENQVFSLHVPVAGMLLKCFDFKLATKG